MNLIRSHNYQEFYTLETPKGNEYLEFNYNKVMGEVFGDCPFDCIYRTVNLDMCKKFDTKEEAQAFLDEYKKWLEGNGTTIVVKIKTSTTKEY